MSYLRFLITLTSLPAIAWSQTSSPAPQTPHWKAISYEKIILPTHSPEAVILTKNESDGKFVYSLSYQVGNRVMTTRAIPTEVYNEMKKKLSHDVLSLTKIDASGTCTRYFDIEGGTSTLKKTIRHCLSATKQHRAAEEAFARWYKSAREILGI